MNYHVITPFSRFENLAPMLNMLKPLGVEWTLLMDSGMPFSVHLPHAWIKEFYFPPAQPFWRAWANHLNAFIGLGAFNDSDRFIILNDDDAVEPGFFKKLDQHGGDFIVCSMMRGHRVPAGGHGHPFHTLLACQENLKIGKVGCEQMIVSGKLFKTLRFADHICADGMAIVDLAQRYPPEFAPEANVWFNWMERGRWNK